jgi:hypothetical protein
MKKWLIIMILGAFLVIGCFGYATADRGPFYVYWTGTCWVAELYLSDTGVLYGEEIGCPNPTVMGGMYAQGDAAMGYDYIGSPRIYEIRKDGTIIIWLNQSTYLDWFNQGTWYLGGPPMEASDLPSPDG